MRKVLSILKIRIMVQQMGNGMADCLAKHLSRFHLFKFISEYHAAGVVFLSPPGTIPHLPL